MIVLTQFTRAIYRGTPQMFAGDNKALGITTMAIFRGYTRALPPLQCVFLPCIVLTCQENLHCHVSIFLPPHLGPRYLTHSGAGGRDVDKLHLS